MLKSKHILILIILIVVVSIGVYVWRNLQSYSLEIQNSVKENNQKNEEIKPKTFFLVGDIMLDRKVELQMNKNGFAYPFEKISEFLKTSDGVFGNLEGPISKNPEKHSLTAMEFAFNAKVIEPLASANFKVLSLANNHTLNMDNAGLEETKNLLTAANIDWVGEPWGCSRKLSIKDEFVFAAFNKTFSGCSDSEIIEIIQSVKSSAPDKFLVVNMHWGAEYKLKSNSLQQDLAHKIIDAGADLIVGTHSHVVQEIENYNGKLIFYSLGNFIFDQYFSEETQKGLIVELKVYPPTKDFEGRVVYNLIPIKSELSQPQVMGQEEAKIFLEKLNIDSIIEIEKEKSVCFAENCFFVEIADTPEKQTEGLMYRDSLAKDRGMLFVFDKEAIYSFWMKNTLIPLDIIWLNGNKEVVFIKNNAQPCQDECPAIKPDAEAKYVLEINSGLANKINLKIGDKLIFK
jgi:poly-gamma-glutamate synthesis protein (capsule biosynthesis protein)